MIKTRFSRWLTFFTFAAAVALALPAKANTWPLPSAGSRLVGENKFHVVENDGGSLEAIAKKYNVGFLALLQANPGVDPYVPRAGSVLTIPLQTLLPDAPREGIVINIAELRLYYYPPGKNSVTVYPIGIGQLGGDTLTPTMVTTYRKRGSEVIKTVLLGGFCCFFKAKSVTFKATLTAFFEIFKPFCNRIKFFTVIFALDKLYFSF